MAPRWLLPALATLMLVAAGIGAACPALADQARTHTVAEGDTLQSIADQYGVELQALIAANRLEAEPDLLSIGAQLVLPGAQPSAPEQRAAARPATSRTHVVQAGDTLRSIAETYGVDILSLIATNGLDDPDILRPGRELRVTPREYVVQPGETLGDIAWRFEVDVRGLMRANAIDDPDLVAAGKLLVMPGGPTQVGAPSAPSQAAAPSGPPSAAVPAQAAAPPAPAPTAVPTPTPSPTRAPERRPQAPAAKPSAPAPVAAAPGQSVMALVTGYALGAGASSSRTASGSTTHWGTVAADTRLYPFGTRLRIEGFAEDMVFVVEDTGSAVRGNIFDVWFPDVASARAFGGRSRRVTILP
jgi:LysM repeat protein/3D (Asp-Asp-Asp) domain-containing protein